MLHSVHVLGSAALALCHVAMGVAEAYRIYGLQCWDVAAGKLTFSIRHLNSAVVPRVWSFSAAAL